MRTPPETGIPQVSPDYNRQMPPLINGEEVLRRVHTGNIPSDWRVFSASRRKLITIMIFISVVGGLLPGSLIYVFLATFINDSSLLLFRLIFILSWIFGSFIVRAILSKRLDNVLVLLPEGFVIGRKNIQKISYDFNYSNLSEIRVVGGIVNLYVHKSTRIARVASINLVDFTSPNIVAQDIKEAYENFRANYPMHTP